MTEEAQNDIARWKKVVFSLVVVLVLLIVGEIGANVYLRVTRGFDGEHLYQYLFDPYKNLLPTPNFVDTRGPLSHNSVGFRRSSEVSLEKPPNTLRIFLMGGSTAYGLGGVWNHLDTEHVVLDNSETIDAYLERVLGDALTGVNVEVINAAVTSTWTHHELIYLNQTILRYDPDVILFLDGFNDYYQRNPAHDQFASYSYNLPSRIIMGEPTLYSAVYQNGWWLFQKSALAHVSARVARLVRLAFSQRTPEPLDVGLAMDRLRANFPANALKMHRRAGVILLDEGIHPVFMLQPMLIMERERAGMVGLERELFEFGLEAEVPNAEDFFHQAVRFVRQEESDMASEIGASYMDLTTAFDTVAGRIYTDYAHLTPLGNEIVAGRVLDLLMPLICEESQAPDATPDIARFRPIAQRGCPPSTPSD